MTSPVRLLILASASTSRARVLTAAGIPFRAVPANVDESDCKTKLKAEGASSLKCAETLAEIKALAVSRQNPDAIVIGADQLLDCGGVWFDKPADRAEAREHLTALSGKTHQLATAAVAVRAGARIWHHVSAPRLSVRTLSPQFIDAYLEAAGDGVLSSVGAYHLEGLGAQLFENVEGDFFTILGVPLLALLAFLREHGIVPR
ncbi:MAG: Maf family protein [Rhodobacteraceae bacterium]|nr:Maf family protein [Paracoccaceae bacterium]